LIVPRSWDLDGTGGMALIDAALATSAAPTYFPAHRAAIRGGVAAPKLDLVDGGISANAPDALAIHHATTELGFPEDGIYITSIGTCGSAEGGIPGERPPVSGIAGAVLRLGGRGIVNLMMTVQESRGINEALRRVGPGRFLRIDATPSAQQAKCLQLDNASTAAQRTLEALASTAVDTGQLQGNPIWQRMLARAQHSRSNPV